MIKFDHESTKAIRFTVDVKGGVQEYALNLLRIINNAREYPHIILKVENHYNNEVDVTCAERYRDSVYAFLTDFGEITEEEPIRWVKVYVEYDSKGYDELYADDIEPDFEVIFE